MIPVSEPILGEAEMRNVIQCVESGWISSGGNFVKEFEEGMADFCGKRFGVAVNNGTSGLIAAFKALPEKAEVVVYTDSKLCLDTITKWAPGWESKGWKRKGSPLKNLGLVKELLALYREHPGCRLEWIAAHNGFRWNEYADSLASAWRRPEL